MNETAQSEEFAADESVTQATLGKVAEESRAIASEAEITAIEEGGRQSEVESAIPPIVVYR